MYVVFNFIARNLFRRTDYYLYTSSRPENKYISDNVSTTYRLFFSAYFYNISNHVVFLHMSLILKKFKDYLMQVIFMYRRFYH